MGLTALLTAMILSGDDADWRGLSRTLGDPMIETRLAATHYMNWFLVLRSDLNVSRGDINAVKGLRIGAAPGPDAGLRQMLVEAGIDLERDHVDVGPIPGTNE